MGTDLEIEKKIVEKGLTAPRVTLEQIEGAIAEEYYFTAASGVRWEGSIVVEGSPLTLLTFCVLVLKNGFTVTGESACASPENFNRGIGQKIARQKAVDRIWALEGYLLRQKLSEGK
jgi:hypothetical protein